MPGALEGEEDLLEVRLRQTGALGDVAHRGGLGAVALQRERQQRPARVVAPRRHLHPDNSTSKERPDPGRAVSVRAKRSASCPLPSPPGLRRALRHQRGARPARPATPTRPSWLPGVAHDAQRVVLLVIDGLGWNQLQTRAEHAPTLALARGRTDHHGGAVHHGHRAHVDHHRASARGARRRRLSDGGGRRGAQRAAVEHVDRRRPPASRPRRSSHGPASAASARRSSPGPSSPPPASRPPTSTACASPATARSARWSPR